MKQLLIIVLLCFAAVKCMGIDYYRPGDTLWVWAKSGLNIREKPDPKSKILGKIVFGGQVIAVDYWDNKLPFSTDEIKKSDRGPDFQLNGHWAKVKYKNLEGYVFDAYLSRLPTMAGRIYETPSEEDFHVAALKKHSKILMQQGKDAYDSNDQKYVRFIFDKGYIIEISGSTGGWRKEMLFPGGLSLIEGYLIYLNTMKYESDVLIEKGEDYLIMEVPDGTVTIKKAGSFLVIFEEHSC